MGTKVIHVEVTGKDGPKLQKFYSDIFGWNLDTNNPGGYGMYRQEDGLTGGIGAAQDGGAGNVTFYVHTDDPQAVHHDRRLVHGRLLPAPASCRGGTSVRGIGRSGRCRRSRFPGTFVLAGPMARP